MAEFTRQKENTLDNKTRELSKKVWNLESAKPQIVNINANGTIPTRLFNSLENNTIVPTDYVDNATNKRTHLYKLNNRIYKVLLEETEV